jgi:methylmalonyl-CoA/ethylmalonyl-CoA epimerase
MNIDHIGIVVKDINEGIEQWETLFGYTQMTDIVTNTRQKVHVVFLRKDNSITIKLISPVSETSPIYKFSRRGGGLHHLCFKTDNLTATINQLESQGLRILAPPQPGEAFENEDIAFIYANNGLNIELIETEKKAKIIE